MEQDDFADGFTAGHEAEAAPIDDGDDADDVDNHEATITWEDTLRYASVKDVSTLFRSARMRRVFTALGDYGGTEAPAKNTITPDDPEYAFVTECSAMAIKIEIEKSKVHKFIRDHYAVRFPELAMLVSDTFTYAKVVKVIGDSVADLTRVIDELDELLPSQIAAAAIVAASTTQGRRLEDAELLAVLEACDEHVALEEAKQLLLEYIQTRMPLIAPNVSAFVGTGIASQLFALAGSMDALSKMDQQALMKLGATRQGGSTVATRTQGFLINVDLVSVHPPEMRAKAMRLVSQQVISLARIDANRRAADNGEGLRAREMAKVRMLRWADPTMVRAGFAHDTYERRVRKRRRGWGDALADPDLARRGTGRFAPRAR